MSNRIADLPRRDWSRDGAEIAECVTCALRTPNGRETLWPIQGVSLLEASENRGVCCFAEVGGGKTHTAALLPTVLGAKRPLLFAPGSMVTSGAVARAHHEIRQHWRMVQPYRVESYEKLARARHVDMLERYRPDCIVCDEAHALKHMRKSAAAKRIRRYLERHPDCTFNALSATPSEHGAGDYLHLILWALRGRAPVPQDYDRQDLWAACLDPAVENRPDLAVFGDALGPLTSYDDAQQAFRARLTSAPGIVINPDSWGEPGSLVIQGLLIKTPPALEGVFEELRRYWRLPDGWTLEDPRQTYGVARELACGFYYRHDPWPPKYWLDARRAWCAFCRDVIESGDEFDTAFQVAEACSAGRLSRDAYDDWVAVRDDYDPEAHKITTWLSDHVLQAAEAWGRSEPGLIWVEHIGFAQELARRTGWTYYTDGMNPEEASGKETIVLAFKANREGKNLQYRWHRNLFVTVPSSSRDWEQAPGRTHRRGQPEDVVTVDYFSTCIESLIAWWAARERAWNQFATQGIRKKIMLAEHLPPEAGHGWAWERKEKYEDYEYD